MTASQSPTWRAFIVLALTLAAFGCDSNPAAPDENGPTLTSGQLNETWVRIAPPEDAALGELERVVQTPDGFVALYRRSLGEGKVLGGWESRLLTSVDGLDWSEQDLLITDENRFFRDLSYGDGRFVAVGHHFQDGLVWFSNDAVSWTPAEVETEALQAVRFVGGRFLALGTFQAILSSVDGVQWEETTTETLQPRDVAQGAGVMVLVGTGPFQRSIDGSTWTSQPVDCDLPGACIEDPLGAQNQPPSFSVFHAAGAFHVGSGWRSADGVDWKQVGETDTPHGHINGYFLRADGETLLAWDDDPTHKITLSTREPTGPEDGCGDGRCHLFGDEILRIPPNESP